MQTSIVPVKGRPAGRGRAMAAQRLVRDDIERPAPQPAVHWPCLGTIAGKYVSRAGIFNRFVLARRESLLTRLARFFSTP